MIGARMPALSHAFAVRLSCTLALAATAAAASATSCTSSSDCSLNGDCNVTTGVCACTPQWSGSPTCDVLALLPASRSDGYHNTSGVSSWGGMSLQDEAGRWRIFAAEMVGHCGLGSWTTNSRVVTGVSSGGAAGPFFTDAPPTPVTVPFSHNPKVFRAPDGTFLLFSIGSGLWTTTPESCASSNGDAINSINNTMTVSATVVDVAAPPYPGPCGDGCGASPLNAGCGLSLGTSSSLEGPWAFAAINITNQSASALLDCAHTNPSPWLFANGSILMAINAGFCHGHLETIGLLTAPSWRGPWTWFETEPILHDADGSIHHCEDPLLWFDERGAHLMVHNQEGGGIARYAHSVDGHSPWVLHPAPGPYDGDVHWDDGTSESYDVERPQLIFENGVATYLTNGALAGSRSFTLFRPLRLTPPPPPPPPTRLIVTSTGACLATSGAFPCWTASDQSYSLCPLILALDCATAVGTLWRVDADAALITSASEGSDGAPINIDCDACAAGAVAKLISSGPSPLVFDEAHAQIRVSSCKVAGGMCLTTGCTGASKPCGNSATEPWVATQVHLAPCTDAETVGWARG